MPKPDGFVQWNAREILNGFSLQNDVRDITFLKAMRDGRFGNSLLELSFHGKKDPIDGFLIESDGKSIPDAWRENNREYEYEIKGFHHAGICLARSKEKGIGRYIKKEDTNQDVAMLCKKWIFVDRSTLTYNKKNSMPYYVVTGRSLASVIEGVFHQFVPKNPHDFRETLDRMTTTRSTGDYQRALMLIHAAQEWMRNNPIEEE